MCGRFIVEDSDDEIGRILSAAAERFGGSVSTGEICPSDTAVILTASSENGMRIGMAGWGLRLTGKSRLIINTRRETVTGKPFYRQRELIRCVVPASSYLEWDRSGKRFRFTCGGSVWMAALLDCSVPGEERFSILTGNAVGACAEIHDRMPLLLCRTQLRDWLCGNAASFLSSDIPVPDIIEEVV